MSQVAVANGVSAYDRLDFKFHFEREFNAHQETRLKLGRALDKIEHLEKKLEKLEADNAYLKKLLFSKKTEQSKKKLKTKIQV